MSSPFWEFINLFRSVAETCRSVREFRERIIQTVRERYTVDDFYRLEKALQIKFFDLVKHLGLRLNRDEIERPRNIYDTVDINSSCINKMVHFQDGKIYIFNNYRKLSNVYTSDPNLLNIMKVMYVMRDKSLYDRVKMDKTVFDSIHLREEDVYYYPCDYPFPNFNVFVLNTNSEKVWKKNIKRLYFNREEGDADHFWYVSSHLRF